ncbi:MAG: phosphonate ABC transporter, permease protein PhnE [Pseudomonadota bacterium]
MASLVDTTLTSDDLQRLRADHAAVFQPPFLKRHGLAMAGAFIVLYSIFCWWFFGVGKALERANWQIAGAYLADWVAYDIRPDVEFEEGYLQITYPRFSPLGDNPDPDWIVQETSMVTIVEPAQSATSSGATSGSGITFMAPSAPAAPADGGTSFIAPTAPSGTENAETSSNSETTKREERLTKATVTMGGATITVDGAGERTLVTVERGGESVRLDVEREKTVTPLDPLPSWAVQKEPGLTVRFDMGWAGRFEVQDDEVKFWKRFFGWENFFFDTNSKFYPLSGGERIAAIFSGDRLVENRSNLSLAWEDFTMNPSWQHWDVWVKLLQTIVMAFVGTLFATLLAFPLSFMAARNISPSRITNQILKRLFDFVRSVDMLIWALFFTRAFGPGPLAGISAIFLTDTGTLGKLYAEALENIDDKQREGVKSVGAGPTLIQRYGVVPQVLPVFLSQSLYFWESNTRSATIIGAVGAGGIGLKLWEAMRTNQDWENVAYMVLLILFVVFLFDGISNYLRTRLIGAAR